MRGSRAPRRRHTGRDRAPYRPAGAAASRWRASSSSESESTIAIASWRLTSACSAAPIIESASTSRGESRRDQGRIAEPSRGSDRALGPLVHLLVARAPERDCMASSDMSATASGEPWSGSCSRAPARRAPACSCRPRRLSTAAQARASLARSTGESSGTIASASSRAAWLSANRPTAVSAPERAQEELDALLDVCVREEA